VKRPLEPWPITTPNHNSILWLGSRTVTPYIWLDIYRWSVEPAMPASTEYVIESCNLIDRAPRLLYLDVLSCFIAHRAFALISKQWDQSENSTACFGRWMSNANRCFLWKKSKMHVVSASAEPLLQNSCACSCGWKCKL